MDHREKYENLLASLSEMGSLAVAFSGGVDSTLLLRAAREALGDRAIAVTALSCTFPERERRQAEELAALIGAEQIVIRSEELEIEGFAENPTNRCYYCKKELFTKVVDIARGRGIAQVADGSNADDVSDFRPGRVAMRELGAVSPLMDAGLTKREIRLLSKELGLPTWDKPSFACLSSRVPYGERITPEKLDMIDRAETFLLGLGFRQVRVRHHGSIARVEVERSEMPLFFQDGKMEKTNKALREIGYAYVALDMGGYRTGSMNDVIDAVSVSST